MNKREFKNLPDHNKPDHDELMSGSFWMTPGPIDIDFYNPLKVN